MRVTVPLALLIAFLVGASVRAESIRFDRDIRPILSDKCFFCHGPDQQRREAGLRLDLQDEASAVIEPGDAQASELIARIMADDDSVMPPVDSHKTLSESEKQRLVRWVEQGANWTRHWSFVSPEKPTLDDQRGENAIDTLVAAHLRSLGKDFSPLASRQKLIRRLTYDLTGMPPTLQEVDAFLSDHSPDAYERLVDRLLDSPRFGQRMAVAWLDAARYGDTSVYHADGPREMWAWRDTVVDAYNRNMPFDQFSIAQLAGDLLPEASLQQRILAGFNRNNGTTDEGGAFAEEYRVEYAVDRVKTTSTVWLGLTMECAQCHDHKYDPISQEDYYRFFAFFNVSSDAGMQTRKGNAAPMLEIPDPEKEAQLPETQQQLATVEADIKTLERNSAAAAEQWARAIREPASGQREELFQADTDLLFNVPLVEGDGDTVRLLRDSEVAGKIHGSVDWIKSRYDLALKLDGNSYVDLGDVADFERTDAFSMSAWIKPQKGAGQAAVLARMDDANAHRGFDLFAGHGPVSVHIIHSWPNNAIKVTTNQRLEAGKWHHVLATYDGSSKADGIKIYVDGQSWPWKIEQDGLTETIRTDKSLLIGSRHPGARFRGEIDEVSVYSAALQPDAIRELAMQPSIRSLVDADPSQLIDEQRAAVREFYLSTRDEQYRTLQQQATKLRKRVEQLKQPLTSVMVMGDMEQPRDTFVLARGAYDSPTETKVDAGTPPVLPPMAAETPRNRLGLARWLFRDDHPLTARVAVNRYWQMLFGHGLVSTPEDFGAQGDYPTHPELLDWLAVDFRESGWDIKRAIKQMVMSRTYRQTSIASPQQYAADPQNRDLARGARFRLQGEFIRDTALSVSGLLVDTYGGPGVKPYQPPGLWAEVGLGGNPKFVQDHGDKLYRRTLYTYWKRSAPPPAMQIFDAPTREKCTIRRARTNTPLQALVTMNDTQFVEAARHFAQRMIQQGGETTGPRLEYGFRMVTARRPAANELDVLIRVLEQAQRRFQQHPDQAEALLATGESSRDESIDAVQLAAWTIAASTLLNLDETLTRE